jgi:hypothetical protein
MHIKYDERSNKIYIEELKKYLTNFPDEVLQDFLSDHGRKYDFQHQYGNIELNKINWEIVEISGETILHCRYYNDFKPWLDGRTDLIINNWQKSEWECIDVRTDVVAHWQKHQTWKRRPIFLDGLFMQCDNEYYLVEGHTRIGVLRGLIKQRALSIQSKHTIWFGTNPKF